MRVFTIGYEGATVDEVLSALRRAGVEQVADVRAVAASRRPGFAKTSLKANLAEAGIGYRHLRALGTPKEGRLAARAGRLDDLFRIYEQHLATPDARQELGMLCGAANRAGAGAKARPVLAVYIGGIGHPLFEDLLRLSGRPVLREFCQAELWGI